MERFKAAHQHSGVAAESILALFGGDRRIDGCEDGDPVEVNLYVGALLLVELAANIRAIAKALSK